MAARWGKLYRGTPAEHSIEPAIAALGLAYRTQLPGYLYGFRYFPDFFIPQLGLVIEIDDKSHSRAAKMLEDAERTEALEARGWTVVRCSNEDAMDNPVGAVKQMLADAGIGYREIDAARRRSFAACLPKSAKCPRKNQREKKAAATKARRARRTNGNTGKSPTVCAAGANPVVAGAARDCTPH